MSETFTEASTVDQLSFANLVANFQALVTSWGGVPSSYGAWATGTATGGFHADGTPVAAGGDAQGGYYPLTNGTTTVYVRCPAAIAANPVGASSATSLSTTAIDNLPVSTELEPLPAIPVSVGDGSATGRQLKKINFFPARRTVDLADTSFMLANDLIPSLRGGATEQRISAANLAKYFNRGVVSPLDYGAKWDARETYLAQSTAGSNIIDCSEGLFLPSDVGKMALLSNPGANGVADYSSMKTTIVAYIDAYHVQLAQTCGNNVSANQMIWGTDDTIPNQQAIEACRAQGLYNFGGLCQLPAGMSLCRGLSYSARMAIVGQGKASQFRRIPQSVGGADINQATNASGQYYPPPSMGNENNQVDFPIHDNYSLDGSHYMDIVGTNSCQGFVFASVDSSQVLTQEDAFPQFRNLDIRNFLDTGMVTYGRGDGSINNIRIESCQGYGWQNGSYDMNILGLYIEACGNAGLYFTTTSGNNNCQNVKLSYNGSNRNGWDSLAGGANFYTEGAGNQITAFRFQESYGANAVMAGVNNTLANGALEDTGDQWWSGIYNGTQPQGGSEPEFKCRPAIAFVDRHQTQSQPAYNNKILDVSIDSSIHPNNCWATHGVFMDDNSHDNYCRIYTNIGTGGTNPTWDGVDPPALPAAYPAGLCGTDSSNGWGATNTVKVNDINVSA